MAPGAFGVGGGVVKDFSEPKGRVPVAAFLRAGFLEIRMAACLAMSFT